MEDACWMEWEKKNQQSAVQQNDELNILNELFCKILWRNYCWYECDYKILFSLNIVSEPET